MMDPPIENTTEERWADLDRENADLRRQLEEAKERAAQYAQDLLLSRDQRTALALDATALQAQLEEAKADRRKWVDAFEYEHNKNAALQAQIDALQGVLEPLINGLAGAERIGKSEDVPEGVRYIQISDTLAREMECRLRTALAQPEPD